MKILFFLLFLIFPLLACEGDCIKCHPVLLKKEKLDNNHKILKNCKKCHKETKEDLERMGSLCGQDCWDCHNIKKTMSIPIKEHLKLDLCIKCHLKLKNKEKFNLNVNYNQINLKTFIQKKLKGN